METATPPPREYLLLSWEERGEWHKDYLSIRVHPVLNTVLFKLVFFFLSTSLIFLVTIAVALAIVKLVEVISACVQFVRLRNTMQDSRVLPPSYSHLTRQEQASLPSYKEAVCSQCGVV